MVDECRDVCGLNIVEINTFAVQIVKIVTRKARVGADGGWAVLRRLELSCEPLNPRIHGRNRRPHSLSQREQFVNRR